MNIDYYNNFESAMTGLNSSLYFIGSVKNTNELAELSDKNLGDVVYVTSEDSCYVFVNNWECIGSYNRTEDNIIEVVEDLKDLTCTHCGAPLIKSRYDNEFKCEYCGTIYMCNHRRR